MKPRRVDFLRNKDDLQALVLGSLGFATDFICKKTGLSVGQVLYRLAKKGIRRMDYRHGMAESMADLVVSKTQSFVVNRVRQSLNGQ